ncbi:putative ligninase h2 protein [Neofusicoccum parvum UCRNP2]|uniref:Peroxidase n=1 Tax=Botryosphaeria parva (strain UCR-NP2) TaxID=1287680 RepID=R1H3Z5_BOTPV|nr:putative ligninase h2 protein [Neofusicoccum parvum UCRNP2]
MRTSTVLLTSACGLAPAYSFSLASSLSSSLDTLDTLKTRALSTIDTLLPRKTPACPAIWTTVSADLTKDFLLNGECTDLARAAIRYAFHDAGTFSTKLPTVAPASGGADGSLLLAPEIDRAENGGLQDYHSYIGGKYAQYKGRGVGAADLIQFAGSHAVVTCPGGPTVRTVVGRTDSSAPSPAGVMPPGFGPGSDHDSLLQLFVDKGFSAADLAALIGAHTTSRSFAQRQLPVGTPQDSTPGRWDVKYYGETYAPPAGVGRFDSDIALSDRTKAVGKEFNGFVNNQGKWVGKFADAMFRLSVLGIPPATYNTFADCTGVLPKATSAKRDIRAAPINDRAR